MGMTKNSTEKKKSKFNTNNKDKLDESLVFGYFDSFLLNSKKDVLFF